MTDCVTTCIANTTGTGLPLQQPTGSGFWAIQPGLTWLFPTDPVVFFGNFSYLHSFGKTESLTLINGVQESLGNVQPGDIWGFNVGMGLALNEKASVSIGYDQSIVQPTSQNGQTVVGSVREILGTLLIGYSYRLSPKTTLNFSIGAGLTRDTPDLTLTLRVPMSFLESSRVISVRQAKRRPPTRLTGAHRAEERTVQRLTEIQCLERR